jgi:phage gp36-like protein
MVFLTPAAFVDNVGLTQVRLYLEGKIHADLDEATFEAVLLEQDLASFDAEAIGVSTTAVQKLKLAVKAANNHVGGFIKSRYSGGLVQSVIDESVLPDLAVKIALVECMHVPDEDAKEERSFAFKQLKEIQKGTVDLGVVDPDPEPAQTTGIRVGSGVSRYNWDAFGR